MSSEPIAPKLQRSVSTLRLLFQRSFRSPRAQFQPHLIPRTSSFWLVMLLLGLTIACLMAFYDEDILVWKRETFPSHGMVVEAFRYITLVGTSGWILIGSAIVGLYISTQDLSRLPRAKRVKRLALYGDANFLFFTVAISGIAANLLKNLLGRARPKLFEELGYLHFDFAAFQQSFASFPSGHSTTSGALSAALVLLWPRYSLVWIVIGALGGMSRIMVDAHYASDVVAGLMFGSLCVIFAARWLAIRGVMFTADEGWLPKRKTHRLI